VNVAVLNDDEIICFKQGNKDINVIAICVQMVNEQRRSVDLCGVVPAYVARTRVARGR
jgi:hypothetical protein